MELSDIKDYFKNNFKWQDSISTGKIDQNQEKAICFYPSKRGSQYVKTLGGKKNKHYDLKKVTILLRYTKNQNSAEKIAKKVYDFSRKGHFLLKKKEYL